ncbi:hypothetical protein CKAH01_15069 [Colletotrichum kahawae]|uniref:ATPase AAA-type core domain-containing protein n=1 Tax=Colletotrichum kahawae TaxID=34407 RepID=A0AAD9YLV5_COLKA|nr:hypothetical protein CKAH01_15069 [Colletotrichum kahawae]
MYHTDPSYPDVKLWIGQHTKLSRHQHLEAATDKRTWTMPMGVLPDAKTSLGRVVFTPSKSAEFMFKNHLLSITQERSASKSGESKSGIRVSKRGQDVEIIQEFFQQICGKAHHPIGTVELYHATVRSKEPRWVQSSAPSRTIDSVVFDERILQNAEGFFSTLATHFKKPVYQLGLNSSEITDSHLYTLFHDIPGDCILLLEDAQVTGLALKKSATYATLLSLLDGLGAQEGRLLIMTTNDQDESQFDEALTRPGRIDHKFKFGNADAACLRRLFLSLTDNASNVGIGKLAEDFARMVPEGMFSPAAVRGFLLEHPDPEKALELVEDWVASSSGSIDSGEKGLKADDS